MPGAAAAPQLAPKGAPRIVSRAWPEPVAVVAFAGAFETADPVPAELAPHTVTGPFDGQALPPTARHAEGPKALVAAMSRAIESAGLGDRLPEPADRAIVVGTSAAALSEVIYFLDEVGSVGASLVNPGLFPFTVMNAAAGLAAIIHCCEGPNLTLNNGPTSALDAVAYAADLVTTGQARIAFAGGFEGIGPQATVGLRRAGHPFVGATVLALTSAAEAAALGLAVRARVFGFGTASAAGGDPRALAREALEKTTARVAETHPGLRHAGAEPETEPRAETVLFALLSAVVRAAEAPAGAAVPLVVAPAHEPAAIALLFGPPEAPADGDGP